jgi:hypothetical protein
MTRFTIDNDKLPWPVPRLAKRDEHGRNEKRTAALAAGLAKNIWRKGEWVWVPVLPQS